MTPEPRIDPTVIDELIDLGPETGVQLVRDLIELFSAEAPSRVAAMRHGLQHRDLKEVSHAAHAMRGGAGNLGAVGIGALCSRVEVEARTDNIEAMQELVDQIEAELAAVQRALEQRLAAME